MTRLETDVAIIGGGLGGVAAALAALSGGARVVVTEPTDWLGGTVRYNELRARVRKHYCDHYGAPETMPDGLPLNLGDGWFSRLCFEPKVGVEVIGVMLGPYLASGQLTVLYRHTPVGATLQNERIEQVTLQSDVQQLELTLNAPLTERERTTLTLAAESLSTDLDIFLDVPNPQTWADACRQVARALTQIC